MSCCFVHSPHAVNASTHVDRQAKTFKHQTDVNFRDPHYAVGLPVFIIHGNHDDPLRDGMQAPLSALDILKVSLWLRACLTFVDGLCVGHVLWLPRYRSQTFARCNVVCRVCCTATRVCSKGRQLAELLWHDGHPQSHRRVPDSHDQGPNEGVCSSHRACVLSFFIVALVLPDCGSQSCFRCLVRLVVVRTAVRSCGLSYSVQVALYGLGNV